MTEERLTADDLYREELLEARSMRLEDKLLEGARLFDRSCLIIMAGLRHQFPEASDEELGRMLEERFDFLQRLEEAG